MNTIPRSGVNRQTSRSRDGIFTQESNRGCGSRKAGATRSLEIKYQGRIGTNDSKNLLRFMEEYGIRFGILITKNRFEKMTMGDREIWYLPAWLALLDQGAGLPGPVNP